MSLFDGQIVEVGGDVVANSTGTVLTSGAANVKGDWVQLIASTAYDSSFIGISLTDMNAGDIDMLVDIAIGADGFEVVILESLYTGSGAASNTYGGYYLFPLIIPEGTRISANVQSSGATDTVDCVVQLFAGGFAQGTQLQLVETYGADVSTSGGEVIDPGSTVDEAGGYTQIVASTAYDIKMLAIAIVNGANVARASYTWLLTVGIGTAASEVAILENIPLTSSSASDMVVPQTLYMLPVNIPAGTRIAVQAQCSGNDAADRILGFIAYGAA